MLGQRNVVGGMSAMYRFRLSNFEQPFASVLVQGVQQPIPDSARDVVTWDDQGLVDEMQQELNHLLSPDAVTSTDSFGGIQVPIHRKHGEPGEELPFRFGKQRVAPIDGGLQSLLSRKRSPVAADQELEALIKSGRKLFNGQPSH